VPNKSRKASQQESTVAGRGFQLICLLSLAMLHWAMILAACPELHELIHHHGADEHHDCAVTAILSGGIEQTPIVAILFVVPGPILESIGISFEAEPFGSFFLSCHILEHAPPVTA
jgi:hypothetical protein